VDVLTTVGEVRAWRAARAGSVGFGPTMGYLHEGHLSLVRRARSENERVAASIFVNPAQFGPGDDLASYPRDLQRDLALLSDAGCDMTFTPSPGELYPSGFQTWVEVGAVAEPLEGARRPGHFRGVATVVLKLFGIVQPTRAYFGQKDAQQLAVVRAMVRDLDVPVEVVGCPTVREADGLAMSSRNVYLGPEDRAAAPVLHRALLAAQAAWRAGERDAERLRQAMLGVLATEPRADVDYVSVAVPATMAELVAVRDGAVASLAVRIGPARLIDNVLLEETDENEGARR
jgi:pantoate--beta-alanine ligase